MSVIKQDESQVNKEAQAREKVERESNDRAKYLAILKNSKKFQKYVVQEIFQKELDESFTLSKLPVSDNMGALGAVALQYMLAGKAVGNIIKKLKP